mmetsp:Transcript_15075/g.45551  ORF Transcript_15075/g.45551 Transcript_15075/m.45551 type:complete len:257 (-) Transcript_15075:971-1741(-)
MLAFLRPILGTARATSFPRCGAAPAGAASAAAGTAAPESALDQVGEANRIWGASINGAPLAAAGEAVAAGTADVAVSGDCEGASLPAAAVAADAAALRSAATRLASAITASTCLERDMRTELPAPAACLRAARVVGICWDSLASRTRGSTYPVDSSSSRHVASRHRNSPSKVACCSGDMRTMLRSTARSTASAVTRSRWYRDRQICLDRSRAAARARLGMGGSCWRGWVRGVETAQGSRQAGRVSPASTSSLLRQS